MRALTCAAFATLLLASSALCQNQVNIPPHNNVYNGYSRGYNFTASTTFFIVSLELPVDAMQAGDTSGFLVMVNGATVLHSIGNTTARITTNIPITTGDVVDVIGNWSPAATGNFTAHNSYGVSAPYATSIEGVPHTLNRTGWQWDIGDPAYLSGSLLAPTTGSIGRVWMYTASPVGFATWTTYGAGCVGGGDPGFYELFTGSSFDLSNTGVTMQAAPPSYVMIQGASPIVMPTTPAQTIGDDQTIQVTLPWAFPYQGGSAPTNDLWVCSNGWIALESYTGTDLVESVSALLSGPTRVCAMWDDLNPAGGGTVHWEQDPVNSQLFHVTFLGVPEFSATGANDFQYTFHQGGAVEFKWGSCSVADCLVGFAVGNGQGDPGSTDVSAITAQLLGDGVQPLTLNNLAGSRPVLGQTFNMEVSEIPGTATLGAMLYSFTKQDPGISLASLGMGGCFQYLNLDASFIFIPTGATHTAQITVPNLTPLVGAHVYAQSAIFGSPATALGVISSNGGDMMLDVQ